MRVKSKILENESLLDALSTRGIEYLELRLFDINPFEKNGLSLDQMYFTHAFLIFCLFETSQKLFKDEETFIEQNHQITALKGRKENIKLYKNKGEMVLLRDWAEEVLTKVMMIAGILDKNSSSEKYQKSVMNQIAKIKNPELLPSDKIYKEIKEHHNSFIDFAINKSKEYLVEKGGCNEFYSARI